MEEQNKVAKKAFQNKASQATKKDAEAPKAPQPKTRVVGEGKNQVKITFLGGVGEIGKNMTVFETANEMIVVDAGLAFPGD